MSNMQDFAALTSAPDNGVAGLFRKQRRASVMNPAVHADSTKNKNNNKNEGDVA